MAHFPGYAQIRRVHVFHGEWTVADGLLTPTLKLRRHRILSRFAREIDRLYEGH
jgi:long-chain acyl-CoA synthetase